MALGVFANILLVGIISFIVYLSRVTLLGVSDFAMLPLAAMGVICCFYMYQLLDLSGRLGWFNRLLTGVAPAGPEETEGRLIRPFRRALDTEEGMSEIAYVKGAALYINKEEMARRPKIIQRWYFLHESGHLLFNVLLGRSLI